MFLAMADRQVHQFLGTARGSISGHLNFPFSVKRVNDHQSYGNHDWDLIAYHKNCLPEDIP